MKTVTAIHSVSDEHACADHNVKDWLEFELLSDRDYIFVATCAQQLALRVAHKKGKVNIQQFEFNGEPITCYSDGRLSDWPKGFFSEYEDSLDELLWEKDEQI